MGRTINALLCASFIALTACGGDGDDALGDNAAEAAEAKADTLEAIADNTSNDAQADALEAQADVVEDVGEAKEEAIDDADVNAHAMSNAQKEAVVNGQ